jgi:hypothetical protein
MQVWHIRLLRVDGFDFECQSTPKQHPLACGSLDSHTIFDQQVRMVSER